MGLALMYVTIMEPYAIICSCITICFAAVTQDEYSHHRLFLAIMQSLKTVDMTTNIYTFNTVINEQLSIVAISFIVNVFSFQMHSMDKFSTQCIHSSRRKSILISIGIRPSFYFYR